MKVDPRYEQLSPAHLAFIAQLVALKDVDPNPSRPFDLFEMHGSPNRDLDGDKLLMDEGIRRYKDGRVLRLGMNSLTMAECTGLAYIGREPWYEYLLDNDIPEKKIVMIGGNNTAAESIGMLDMCQTFGWKKVAIGSQPHHILRCFRTLVQLMVERGQALEAYCITTPGIRWDQQMVKKVLPTAGADVIGTLFEHAIGEVQRGEKYEKAPEKPGDYIPHATLPLVLTYLDNRAQMAAAAMKDGESQFSWLSGAASPVPASATPTKRVPILQGTGA